MTEEVSSNPVGKRLVTTSAMKKNLYGAAVCLALTLSLGYSLITKDAWDFWNNLVATLMGIAIGVPVGLFVDRKQARRTEEKRLRNEERQKQEHITKIVGLLRKELNDGLRTLKAIRSASSVNTWTGHQPIKIELWQAFSDGGEIHWIDDPNLLDALASAYHELRLHDKYQNGLLQVRSNTTFSSEVFKQAVTAIIRLINDQINRSIDIVSAAERSCQELGGGNGTK